MFIIAKVETTQSSSTDEGMNKIWYIHTMKILFNNKKRQDFHGDTG